MKRRIVYTVGAVVLYGILYVAAGLGIQAAGGNLPWAAAVVVPIIAVGGGYILCGIATLWWDWVKEGDRER